MTNGIWLDTVPLWKQAIAYTTRFTAAPHPFFALLTQEQTRQLAEMHADPALVDRLADLAAKANEGDLSPGERAEYEAYIEANNFLATLQAEARFRLSDRLP